MEGLDRVWLALLFLLPWVVPGRSTVQIREPANDLIPEIIETGQKLSITGLVVAGDPTLNGGMYFTHAEKWWFWPWWGTKPYPVFYTHELDKETAERHGHITAALASSRPPQAGETR